jgi:hypothetical protein
MPSSPGGTVLTGLVGVAVGTAWGFGGGNGGGNGCGAVG